MSRGGGLYNGRFAAIGYGTVAGGVNQAGIAMGIPGKSWNILVDSAQGNSFGVVEYMGGNSWINRLNVLPGGNVGIGTMSLPEKINVNGVIYGNDFIKSGNLSAANAAISLWSSSGTNGGFIAGFDNGRSIGMGITNSGYIGLGIGQGATAFGSFYYDPFGSGIVVQSYGIRPVVLNSSGDIWLNANGQNRLFVRGSDGNVGIGTTWPAGKLDVWYGTGANVRRFILQDDGNAVIYNSAGTALWNAGTWSSIRFKENVKPVVKALDKVMKLRGVNFDWKAGRVNPFTGNSKGLGLIAEEVGEVLPEIVSYEKDGSGYAASFDYDKLTAVLVEAIKEQQKEIEELKVEIQGLKTKL